MFGRHARLPVDMLFGTDPDKRCAKGPLQYVKDLRNRLQFAFEVAKENAEKASIRNKGYYDQKARAATLEPGDRVLVRNVGIQGKHKIADRWKPGVYVVDRQQGDLPVYVVQLEDVDGPVKTYHRNMLLPIGTLPLDVEEPERVQHPRRPRTRSRARPQRPAAPDDTTSDDETDWCAVLDAPAQRTLNPDAPAFEPHEDAPNNNHTDDVLTLTGVPSSQDNIATVAPTPMEPTEVASDSVAYEPESLPDINPVFPDYVSDTEAPSDPDAAVQPDAEADDRGDTTQQIQPELDPTVPDDVDPDGIAAQTEAEPDPVEPLDVPTQPDVDPAAQIQPDPPVEPADAATPIQPEVDQVDSEDATEGEPRRSQRERRPPKRFVWDPYGVTYSKVINCLGSHVSYFP